MASELLFEEVQQFDRKKSQGFLKGLMGVLLLCYILLLIFSNEYRKELSVTIFFLVAFVILTVLYFAIPAKLITQVRIDGIYVRFPPFVGTSKFFAWSNIAEIYLREYNPIQEYYGWGIRNGPSGYAYSVSGTIGLQLILKNGSKVLIGTNHPQEIKEVLGKMNK